LLLDFGQNLVGWLRLRVHGPAGHTITLTHAEVLENGDVATRPLRTAKCTDTLILNDKPIIWEPRFTFHGFRYVRVDNWPTSVSGVSDDPSKINLADFTAVVIHTDMARTGTFTCSNPLLNKLHENVVWSMRDNFVGIPTDCPQCDERLGWTGDMQAFAPTASFLYNCHGMLKTWLRNLAAEQMDPKLGNGVVGLFSPNPFRNVPESGEAKWCYSPTAIWGDAAVMVPWDLYRASGDVTLLRDQYESMKIWLEKGVVRDPRTRLWDPSTDQLGDWLDPLAPPDEPGNGQTDPILVANAFLIRSTDLGSEICAVLGLESECDEYRNDAVHLRGEFAKEYITENGRLVADSQTALALAIYFDLLPTPSQRATAGKRLKHLILTKSRFRISTGFAGTPVVGHALSSLSSPAKGPPFSSSSSSLSSSPDGEGTNIFYRMLLHRRCPSWLYPVTMGASTIWSAGTP
jgi:alpha-L-rhamnosidase